MDLLGEENFMQIENRNFVKQALNVFWGDLRTMWLVDVLHFE